MGPITDHFEKQEHQDDFTIANKNSPTLKKGSAENGPSFTYFNTAVKYGSSDKNHQFVYKSERNGLFNFSKGIYLFIVALDCIFC